MAGRKVLVVDDEIHIIHVVTIKLRNSGFEVITAQSAQEAYDLACRELPDVIITDYQMPNMTGLELLKTIRSDAMLKNTPVLLITAEAEKENVVIAAQAGVNDYIVKPFTGDVLQQKINKIFG